MTNPNAGRPVDPRFDPVFQPGYDPLVDPDKAAGVPIYEASGEPLVTQPGRVVEPPRSRYAPPPTGTTDSPAFRVAPALGDTADLAPRVVSDAESSAEIRSNSDSGTTPASEAAPEGAKAHGRNPFVFVLWVLGLVFIGVGMFTAQQVLDPTTDLMVAAIRGDTVNYFSVQLYTYGAPLLIVLGLMTITLVLSLQALRWQSRR